MIPTGQTGDGRELCLRHGEYLPPGRGLVVPRSGAVRTADGRRVVWPEFAGVRECFSGQERGELRAEGPTTVTFLDEQEAWSLLGDDADVRRRVVEELAKDVPDQSRHFADAFRAPNARLFPGPYVVEPSPLSTFFMRDDPERIQRALPEGLHPLPGFRGLYLIVLASFGDLYGDYPGASERRFRYDEVTYFIPCIGPGLRPGLFAYELYPDNYLAILLGREIYGFPKRFGQLRQQHLEASLLVDGLERLRFSWRSARDVGAKAWAASLVERAGGGSLVAHAAGSVAETLPGVISALSRGQRQGSVRVFVHKEIPSVSSRETATQDVDQLNEVPFELSSSTGFTLLEGASVELLRAPNDLGGHCVGAGRVVTGLRLGAGRTVVDYRARERSLTRRVAKFLGLGRADHA